MPAEKPPLRDGRLALTPDPFPGAGVEGADGRGQVAGLAGRESKIGRASAGPGGGAVGEDHDECLEGFEGPSEANEGEVKELSRSEFTNERAEEIIDGERGRKEGGGERRRLLKHGDRCHNIR